MARFGDSLGMAFQIVDDLLDFTEPEAVTGKPSGQDLKEHKVTLPLIYALPRMAPAEREDVNALMAAPEPSSSQIATVIDHVARAGGLEYARARAHRHGQEAEAQLDRLHPTPERELLRASIAYVLDRRR
jgi:octaprenyl-diphosphate synthase